MKFKYGVVLTGGIATGKSTTADIFRSYGVEIIDADKIGHETLEVYSEEINDLFDEDILIDGEIDRPTLGKIIFSNNNEREKLNEFIHPKIKQEIILRTLSLENKERLFLVDIPLFFETNNYNEFDKVIVVYTTPEKQLEQLVSRNGFSKEEALKRINSQMNINEKKLKGTETIYNIENIEHLKSECLRVFNNIT